MSKIAIIVLSLLLAACNPQTIFSGITLATAQVANPVTPAMLYDLENGMIVGFAGLQAYKTACAKKAILQSCKGVIVSIQTYTKQVPPLLSSLRVFVKNNDQVNAAVVYKTIADLLANYKALASANGVAMGGN